MWFTDLEVDTRGAIVQRNYLTMAFVLPPAEFVTPPSNPPDRVISTRALSEAEKDDAPLQEKPDATAEKYSNAPPEGTSNAPAKDSPGKLQSHINDANHDHVEARSVRGSNNDEISYPEGGLRAWLVVVGSCFGTAVSLGMM